MPAGMGHPQPPWATCSVRHHPLGEKLPPNIQPKPPLNTLASLWNNLPYRLPSQLASCSHLWVKYTQCFTDMNLAVSYHTWNRLQISRSLQNLHPIVQSKAKKKTTEQPSNKTKSNPTHQNQGAYAQPEYYFSSHFRVLVTIIAQHLHCIFWTSTKGIAQTCLTYFSSVTRCYALLPSPAG